MNKTYPSSVEELSVEQLNRFIAFKDSVSPLLADFPEMNTQWHVFRFYRSKKFNEESAFKALKDFVEYRKMIKISEIMSRDHSDYDEIEKNIAVGRYGTDKAGRPIIIRRMGRGDHKHIMKDEFNRLRVDYFIQQFERLLFIELPMASYTARRRVDKVIIINDFNGLGLSKMLDSKLKAFFKLLVTVSQTNYPELIEHAFVINVPSMFKGMWSMLQSWFGNTNSNRVSLHSSVPFDKLSEYIDMEKLPIYLGGKNETPLNENFGPWKDAIESSKVRKSFFLEDRSIEYEYFYTEEEKQALKKSRGSTKLFQELINTDSENMQKGEVRYFLNSLGKQMK